TSCPRFLIGRTSRSADRGSTSGNNMGSTPQTPPTPPTSSGSPTPSSGVRQQYQPPEGAISIVRVKRVGIAGGLLVLGYFTIWGSCHRQPATPEKKKATAQVWPMSPANIDSQQAELDR